MPSIPLQDIHPNPFRDFELHPIDPVQVEKLKASIEADGFWASVVARPAATGGYELAFGHHRIEAARAAGMAEAPIEIRDLSDWQMVRMLTAENATQRGSTAAAALDAVAAIARVLAYSLLRWEEARFGRNLPNVDISYAECRGRLEAGTGLGHECIRAAAPSLTEYEVRASLHTLKDSGRMARIIAIEAERASVELLTEQEEAERALAEEETRQAAAKDKASRAAAAKRTKQAKRAAAARRKATAATSKAVASAERKPIIYDDRCAQLFKMASHAEAFRKTVTGETFQAYLPLDQQYGFAKAVLAKIREDDPNKKEITASDIRVECWDRIQNAIGVSKQHLRTAPERPYRQEVVDGLNFIRRAFNDYRRGMDRVESALRKGETLTAKQTDDLNRYIDGFAARFAIRDKLSKKLKLVEEQ